MDPDANQDIQHELSRQRSMEREMARQRIEEGDPAWHHETGLLAVVDAVRDLQFPQSKDDLRQRVGDRYVRTSEDATMPLAEVLAKLPETEFASPRDFERAVQKHWAGVKFEELRPEHRPEHGGKMPFQDDQAP